MVTLAWFEVNHSFCFFVSFELAMQLAWLLFDVSASLLSVSISFGWLVGWLVVLRITLRSVWISFGWLVVWLVGWLVTYVLFRLALVGWLD